MPNKPDYSNATLGRWLSLEWAIGLVFGAGVFFGGYQALSHDIARQEHEITELKKSYVAMLSTVADIRANLAVMHNEQGHVRRDVVELKGTQRRAVELLERYVSREP